MDEKVLKFYSTLSDDVKGKLKACKNKDEMIKILEDANISLDPELLKSVSGGVGEEIDPLNPMCTEISCGRLGDISC